VKYRIPRRWVSRSPRQLLLLLILSVWYTAVAHAIGKQLVPTLLSFLKLLLSMIGVIMQELLLAVAGLETADEGRNAPAH